MSFMGSGFGFDETMGGPFDRSEDRPSLNLFRSSEKPDMGNVSTSLFGTKSMTLSEAPRMPPMAKGTLKKVPLVGSAYTGFQTAQTNSHNLSPFGQLLHGLGTGGLSALTPPPVSLLDSVSGDYLGNAQNDLVGGMLQPFFGKEKE